MQIQSVAFKHNQQIPLRFTCDGENISPPLSFINIPDEARSLVIVCDDIDSYAGVWHHWLMWNIPPGIEGTGPGVVPQEAVEGTNSFGRHGYGGPCPKEGTHRYVFRLYAMEAHLDLPPSTTKEELEAEMVGLVIEKAELVGVYERI